MPYNARLAERARAMLDAALKEVAEAVKPDTWRNLPVAYWPQRARWDYVIADLSKQWKAGVLQLWAVPA